MGVFSWMGEEAIVGEMMSKGRKKTNGYISSVNDKSEKRGTDC